jgi:HrpA-like RNA helicase
MNNGKKVVYDSNKNLVTFQNPPDSQLTLHRTGSIIPQKWMRERTKDEAQTMQAIKFIIKQLNLTYPQSYNTKLTYPAKTIGDKVFIIRAGTASGKSTVLPVEIYREFFGIHHKNIVITQPRVITTINTPLDIVKYNLDIELNKNISYTTGSQTSEKCKGIQFYVIDSFLTKLTNLTDQQISDRYSHIIIDEVHERSITTDLTLYMLKLFLQRNFQNDNCPNIILASATIEPEFLTEYFDIPQEHFIDVQGKSFPVTEHYQEFDQPITKAIEIAAQIHKQPKPGNILIFVSGNKEIDEFKQKLKLPDAITLSVSRKDTQNQTIDYKTIYKPTPQRKIMIATNAAETGVTLPDVNFVIDTGNSNKVTYNPYFNIKVSNTTSITKDSQQQRKGRTGRRNPGEFYATYSKATQSKMNPKLNPNIITEDITNLILKLIIKITNTTVTDIKKNDTQTINLPTKTFYLKQEHKFNINKLDFLTPPSITALTTALEKLTDFNYINQSHQVTYQGYLAANLPIIPLEATRMILSSYYNEVNTQDAIILAAITTKTKKDLTNKQYQQIPIHKNKTYSQFYYKTRIADDLIEMLINFHLFQHNFITSPETITTFAETNNLNFNGFVDLIKIKNDITLKLIEFGHNPFYQTTEDTIKSITAEPNTYIKQLKQTIYDGYKYNIIKDTSNTCTGNYKLIRKPLKVNIQSPLLIPLSNHKLIQQKCPKYIITTEITYKQNQAKSTGYISILDPYISPDETLFSFM